MPFDLVTPVAQVYQTPMERRMLLAEALENETFAEWGMEWGFWLGHPLFLLLPSFLPIPLYFIQASSSGQLLITMVMWLEQARLLVGVNTALILAALAARLQALTMLSPKAALTVSPRDIP